MSANTSAPESFKKRRYNKKSIRTIVRIDHFFAGSLLPDGAQDQTDATKERRKDAEHGKGGGRYDVNVRAEENGDHQSQCDKGKQDLGDLPRAEDEKEKADRPSHQKRRTGAEGTDAGKQVVPHADPGEEKDSSHCGEQDSGIECA